MTKKVFTRAFCYLSSENERKTLNAFKIGMLDCSNLVVSEILKSNKKEDQNKDKPVFFLYHLLRKIVNELTIDKDVDSVSDNLGALCIHSE